MTSVQLTVFATGCLVWAAVGVFLLFLLLAGIAALWREVCFYAYCVFGDKADKQARLEAARQRAAASQ
jgi:hypothetical protein